MISFECFVQPGNSLCIFLGCAVLLLQLGSTLKEDRPIKDAPECFPPQHFLQNKGQNSHPAVLQTAYNMCTANGQKEADELL